MTEDGRTRVERALDGYQDTALVLAAVRLDLPDLLESGQRRAAALASAAGCRVPELVRLLRGLCLLGLVTLEDDDYQLTADGRTLLRDHPGSYRARVEVIADQYWEPWSSLDHTVRTGETAFVAVHGAGPFEWRALNPGSGRLFSAWLDRETAALTGSVLTALDLGAARSIADLGGGEGALLRALLDRDPLLNGILLDRAEVIERARAGWPPAFADRTAFVAGDLFGELGVRADAYLLKSVLHDWTDEQVGRILERVAAEMAAGACLYVVERLLDPARPETVRLDLHMMAVTGGRERSRAEFEALAAAAGLVVHKAAPTASGLTVLVIGRP